MTILFVGDVFGETGRAALGNALPGIRREHAVDVCIVNGENASHGRGLSLQSAEEIYLAGADCITMGNHTWNNHEIYQFIDDYSIVRPANFASNLPGKGSVLLEQGGFVVGVVNLQGRVYMDPCDNPFEIAEREVSRLRERTPVIFVDFHAEATAEKAAMAYFLDGRVTAVAGTHTHVQTADERILPGGTAFITDVGMTGPHGGIIGMDKGGVLNKFVRCVPQKFKPAEGCGMLHAALIRADAETGKALEISRISMQCE
ncbi:MAG TPA: TIGR00282 family metallophosphoesterase [Clostridiales bacterium]|uniref:TIGR00282 family metallophosphoesterase n=1 Tax=Candidatus Egerieisoma faecipullorum TaxID=2840963 RepID=A0A9D1I8L5_9CLOT|nr:TIGR00282 family metallophosphoesterase [Clostridiales bacterium]HIU30146.1 TIGR00282 family metallophosphoesterase [Candidatus Egerieisoma faecipullorum]